MKKKLNFLLWNLTQVIVFLRDSINSGYDSEFLKSQWYNDPSIPPIITESSKGHQQVLLIGFYC